MLLFLSSNEMKFVCYMFTLTKLKEGAYSEKHAKQITSNFFYIHCSPKHKEPNKKLYFFNYNYRMQQFF